MYDDAPNEGMRCIKTLVEDFLQSKGINEASYSIFNVRKGVSLPSVADFDAFISTGGPGSPILENSDWESNYFQLIEALLEHNKKSEIKKQLFAICHSFQLLYQYFDLGIITKRKSTSFGVMPVHKTFEGHHDPLYRSLNDPMWAVDSRDYQITQPSVERIEAEGGAVLCIEKYRPHVDLERA